MDFEGPRHNLESTMLDKLRREASLFCLHGFRNAQLNQSATMSYNFSLSWLEYHDILMTEVSSFNYQGFSATPPPDPFLLQS